MVTFLIRTLIFESYVIWWGTKNGYHKDMCSKDIGLRAQKMMIILDALVNIINLGAHMTQFTNQHKNLRFHNEKDIHMSSRIYKESGCGLVSFANHLIGIVCFIF
jgi:hypothetical protein